MSRRGRHPCLIFGVESPGLKGGTVCADCRRKVDAFDALSARMLLGTVPVRMPSYPSIPGGKREVGVNGDKADISQGSTGTRGHLEALLHEHRAALDEPPQRWRQSLPEDGNRFDLTPQLPPAVLASRRASDPSTKFYIAPKALAQVLVDLDPFLRVAPGWEASRHKRGRTCGARGPGQR